MMKNNSILLGRLHGVALQVFKVGLLIIGKSGIGKTDTALSLVEKGHLFLADDIVEYNYNKNEIILYPVADLPQFMHVRGLGFIDVSASFYNYAVTLSHLKLDLIVELSDDDALLNKHHLSPICSNFILNEELNLSVPKFIIPVGNNRNLALLVEQIVKIFIDQKNGVDKNKDFLIRYNKFFKEQP